ncbi:hypothetical protein LPB67_07885 [Undibacterium sp. Jales W-56]|uniref:hypothetical protein n=1 Tax=Undibacterium sp. Jales W-56 TaxID=2897325 RepID=UPI0021D12BE3|nr:hypothetical protein [Undibacterium sp. Jales W-56]MCU6433697.1 hypothetical protein [Undibacterium sp. Jales W-56]
MRSKKDGSKQVAKPKRGAVFEPVSGRRHWLVRHWRPALIASVLMIVVGAWWFSAGLESGLASAAPKSVNSTFLKMPQGQGNSDVLMSAAEREQRLAELAKQVELADHTLCSYRKGSQYPQESRPIAEHPDQVYPNQPVEEKHAMRKENGQADKHVQIQTSQSHIFLASRESVTFSLKASDEDGKALPIFVTRAVARGLTFQGSREAPQVPVSFGDDGSNGDLIPGDNTYTGSLSPAMTGFAQFNGTIRLEVKYNVGDRAGIVFFDVIYSPEVPATWAGSIREAVEQGSLNFYMKADIRQAGRYVVSGRIDDAKGKPYALATFNDVLPQGATEIKLSVFGKLMRDQEPAFPLTLRDVDAYLLKENTDPDRALMSRIVGPAYTSKTYSTKTFSDAEWQSQERSRYLNEFSKDLNQAQTAMLEMNPALTKASLPRSDCTIAMEAKL